MAAVNKQHHWWIWALLACLLMGCATTHPGTGSRAVHVQHQTKILHGIVRVTGAHCTRRVQPRININTALTIRSQRPYRIANCISSRATASTHTSNKDAATDDSQATTAPEKSDNTHQSQYKDVNLDEASDTILSQNAETATHLTAENVDRRLMQGIQKLEVQHQNIGL